MAFWAGRRVAVTGGGGFLGSFVVEALGRHGCPAPFVVRSRDYDLRAERDIVRLLRDARPDVIVHLAATVGGIGANRENPGRFFYENLMMGAQLIAREFLYVEDAAEAIVLAAERYDGREPVNIGAGFEISIRDLVEMIADLTGFKGTIAGCSTRHGRPTSSASWGGPSSRMGSDAPSAGTASRE